MTPNTFIRITRHAGALLALCLSLGLTAGAATPATPAPTPAKVTASKATTLTPEQRALHERIDQAKQGVAGLHRGSSGLKCEKCHGARTAPDDNQTVENRACVACHEDYAALAAETAKKLSNKAINPHGSHLGPEIACTACHQGHKESKAYCVNCHTNFSMPMPGNGPAAR